MKKQGLALLLGFLMAAGFTACEKSSNASEGGGASQSGQIAPAEPAGQAFALIDEIMNSYSAGAFKAGVVPDEFVDAILRSGQKAPSAGNGQPWYFTVIKNAAAFAPQLAPRHYRAGAVVIVISGRTDTRFGSPAFDCALAAQNMYLAAQSLGLGVRMYYSGVREVNDNWKSSLGIPDNHDAQIILLVGYVDDNADAVTSASPRRALAENLNYIE